MPVDGAEGIYQIISTDGKNKIRLNADGTLEIVFADSISIEVPTLNIKADTLNLDGDMNVTGDITNSGSMTTGGKHTDNVGGHMPPM